MSERARKVLTLRKGGEIKRREEKEKKETAVEEAGAEHCDLHVGHIVHAQLLPKRFCESKHGTFRGSIHSSIGERDKRCCAGNIQNERLNVRTGV